MEQNMYFGNLQEGLAFAFEGFSIHIINIGANEPYFIGPELVPIFNVKNSSYLTRYLNETEFLNITVPELNNLAKNFDGPLYGWSNNSAERGGLRHMTLISLGGVFALCNRLYNRNENVGKFAYYINHTILPELWKRPDLVKELEETHRALEQAEYDRDIYHNLYRDYYNDRNRMVQERNMYRNNPKYMLEYYYDLLDTDPDLNPTMDMNRNLTTELILGIDNINITNPNFDRVKYDKVISGIKMCRELLKGYLR